MLGQHGAVCSLPLKHPKTIKPVVTSCFSFYLCNKSVLRKLTIKGTCM